ncbi:PspC domain-containing protein [Streptococcus infantis]|uniref:PspC domain-containing protein n=1 Tax=Streptococcus infantis TaxID=68892 RepID=UPI00189828E4|nr:PspC domain-containing protein [Streptococcus infantis]
MKEFLAGFQVDTENKALAGVCAGLGNYFNIQANIVRLVTVFLFLSSTEIGIITVTLYAYLAGWLGNEPLGDGAKKARNQAILLLVVCLLLVSLGAEGLTAIFESGKSFGQWLSGLF